MPARLTYEKLMNDDEITQQILNTYVKKKTLMLRRNEFDIDTHDPTLQIRLDRLCEFKVLEKVNRDGRPTKGGRKALETFYLLHRVYWKRAVWAHDMRVLKETRVDKISFRRNVSFYGSDESDFEGLEQEREDYERIIDEINLLISALGGLKMRVVKKKLHQHSKALEKETNNPLVQWMVERYLWEETIIPLIMSVEEPGRRFLEDWARSSLDSYAKGYSFDDEERRRVDRSFKDALKLLSTHGEVFRDAVKEAQRFLGGVLVGHAALKPQTDITDLSRTEAAFDTYLESGKEPSSVNPTFELLAKYARDTHQYSVKESRLSLAMGMAIKKGGMGFVKKYFETQEELDKDFLKMALETGFLDPPPFPTPEELRGYWASEGK